MTETSFHDQASEAIHMCVTNPECTHIDLWSGGKKLHRYFKPEAAVLEVELAQ
jgi:hypothetical protein